MKYCPVCESEYRNDIATCADCNARLIEEHEMKKIIAAREQEARLVFVKVATAENQFEADSIKNALEKEDIPVMVRNFHDTAYNGIFIPQKGWGIILVPREMKDKAAGIILSLQRAF